MRELSQQVRERTLAQIVVIGMIVQIVVIAFTFWSSYQGRVDLQTNMRRACYERNLAAPSNQINCHKAFPKATLFP